MSDFINNFRAIHHFLGGILSNGRGEYVLSFVRDDDGRWFIDMPWDGNRNNLEMVAGADDLLTYLDTKMKYRVNLHVVPSEMPLDVKGHPEIEGHKEMKQIDKSLFGGAHYDATAWPGFRMPQIWICPVTLCVLGKYPKYLYVKKVGL